MKKENQSMSSPWPKFKKVKNGDKVESSYLSDLVNSVPTAANIEHYAEIN